MLGLSLSLTATALRGGSSVLAITDYTFDTGTNAGSFTSPVAGTCWWGVYSSADPFPGVSAQARGASIKAGTGAQAAGSFAVAEGSNAVTVSFPNPPLGTWYFILVVESAESVFTTTDGHSFVAAASWLWDSDHINTSIGAGATEITALPTLQRDDLIIVVGTVANVRCTVKTNADVDLSLSFDDSASTDSYENNIWTMRAGATPPTAIHITNTTVGALTFVRQVIVARGIPAGVAYGGANFARSVLTNPSGASSTTHTFTYPVTAGDLDLFIIGPNGFRVVSSDDPSMTVSGAAANNTSCRSAQFVYGKAAATNAAKALTVTLGGSVALGGIGRLRITP